MLKEQSVFYRIASRKSSLIRFTHLFLRRGPGSSKTAPSLISPTMEKHMASLERERGRFFMGQPGGRVCHLHPQIARGRFRGGGTSGTFSHSFTRNRTHGSDFSPFSSLA
jgi:hypothetical protein